MSILKVNQLQHNTSNTQILVNGGAGTAGIGSVLINFQILASVAVGTGAIGVEIPTARITEVGVAGTSAIGDATNIALIYTTWGQGTWGEDTWGN